LRRADAEAALAALPVGLRPLVERLRGAGERLGLGVALVGGPVRDLLLGRPLLDVDLVVEPRATGDGQPRATGDGEAALRLAEAAVQAGERIVAHERFGTVSVTGAAGSVDLAAARAERYAADGALPEVRPARLEDDLARRDFGVNALAIPLNEVACAGRPPLVDPCGGRADLRGRRLRVLHARSFHDDPTRAWRAARLAARLGFRLEPGSRAALGAALAEGAFAKVSGERHRAELERLFAEARQGADPGRALARLAAWQVLPRLARGLALPPAARAALRRLAPLLAAPPRGLAPDPLLAGLMAWLAALAPRARAAALARLALSGRPAERVLAYPALAARATRALARSRGRGADDAALGALPAEELLALAAAAEPELRRRILRHAREDRAAKLPLDGTDLLALGLAGPEVGRTLAALRRACLDGEIAGREHALAWVRARRRRARRS
jgi:tRNA nucleotidyltransferase (CCA-adding enzyme)